MSGQRSFLVCENNIINGIGKREKGDCYAPLLEGGAEDENNDKKMHCPQILAPSGRRKTGVSSRRPHQGSQNESIHPSISPPFNSKAI
jgi:hypothetical protein